MSDDHDDFAFEPIPGLPDRLPAGESLVWQGSPAWRSLATDAFHIRKVAAYFGLILVWQLGSAIADGASLQSMATRTASVLGLTALAIGILCLLAYAYARGTIYTLTSRRIVIRTGLALPVTLNLPLALIDTAGIHRRAAGIGSIALSVVKPNRIAWLALWPNVRPWRLSHPQPLLRSLADVDRLAVLIGTALDADARGEGGQQPLRASPRVNAEASPAAAGAILAA